jgi:two-component system, LytTR family, sensor kinase
MKNKAWVYWIFNAGGWLAYGLSLLIFEYTRTQANVSNTRINRIVLSATLGFVFTHILRTIIVKFNLKPPFRKRHISALIICILTIVLLYSSINSGIVEWLKIYDPTRKISFQTRAFFNLLNDTPIILAWTSFYYLWHYIQMNTKAEIDTIRLESMVKDLELQTIKSHINPHFIFNALNSIRALVLRSSMQAEKIETTTLEKELNIVKDYLALEHIRFEDRLKIEYDIDDETLDQLVPPMMLQTLVENAIKHGISKEKKGGYVKIISDFSGNVHELTVQNTGHLNGNYNHDGFGIASTMNRLNLMYGNKAHFELKDINGNTVQAKVSIPL